MSRDDSLRELQALLEKSNELRRTERVDEDHELLKDAVVRFPESAEVVFRLAVASPDEPELARELTRRAIALEPDNPWRLTRAASLLVSLDDFATAKEYLKRVLNTAPEDFEYATDAVHLVGRVAVGLGESQLAEQALGAAFDDEPAAKDHGLALASLLFDQGRAGEALDVIARSLEYRPGDQQLAGLRNRIERAGPGG